MKQKEIVEIIVINSFMKDKISYEKFKDILEFVNNMPEEKINKILKEQLKSFIKAVKRFPRISKYVGNPLFKFEKHLTLKNIKQLEDRITKLNAKGNFKEASRLRDLLAKNNRHNAEVQALSGIIKKNTK